MSKDELIKKLTLDVKNAQAGLQQTNAKVDELDKSLAKTGKTGKKSTMDIYAGYMLVKEAATMVISTVMKFVKASAAQEDELRKVNFMFGDQADRVIGLSNRLQRLTGVGDNTTQRMAVMAKTMGATNDNIEEIIKGAIGLEKALGVDANSAVKMLTMAIQENDYTLLNRYIPALRVAETETEKAAILNDTLAKSYALAEDRMKGVAGTMETMANTYQDGLEQVGKEINKTFGIGKDSAINGMLQTTFDVTTAMIQYFRNIGENIGIFVLNATEHFTIFGKVTGKIALGVYDTFFNSIKGLGDDLSNYWNGDWEKVGDGMTNAFMESFNKMTAEIKNEIDSGVFLEYIELTKDMGQEVIENNEALVSSEEEKAAAVKYSAQVTEEATARAIEITQKQIEAVQELSDTIKTEAVDVSEHLKVTGTDWAIWAVNNYSEHASAIIGIGQALAQTQLNLINNRYNEEKAALEQKYHDEIISKEQYEKELSKIDKKKAEEEKKAKMQQKAWSVAESVMNTAVAVTKALPNIPLSVLIGLLGAAQVTKIATQEFADGGIPAEEDLMLYNKRGQFTGKTMSSKEYITPADTTANPASQAHLNAALVASGRQPYFQGAGVAGQIDGSGLGSPTFEIKNELIGDKIMTMVTQKQNEYSRAGGNLESL